MESRFTEFSSANRPEPGQLCVFRTQAQYYFLGYMKGQKVMVYGEPEPYASLEAIAAWQPLVSESGARLFIKPQVTSNK